jgi:hypothetical protein
LVALGLGTCYIFQTFLNIGGVTKFIPSTGVTLPLVSYGGSSVLSTFIMFAIIQGLYILKEDEDAYIESKKQKRQTDLDSEGRDRHYRLESSRRSQGSRTGRGAKASQEKKKEKIRKSRIH